MEITDSHVGSTLNSTRSDVGGKQRYLSRDICSTQAIVTTLASPNGSEEKTSIEDIANGPLKKKLRSSYSCPTPSGPTSKRKGVSSTPDISEDLALESCLHLKSSTDRTCGERSLRKR